MTHTNGADGGIGGLSKGVIVAIAEHFCLRIHLGMDLEANDCFQYLHSVRIALLCTLEMFDFF